MIRELVAKYMILAGFLDDYGSSRNSVKSILILSSPSLSLLSPSLSLSLSLSLSPVSLAFSLISPLACRWMVSDCSQ